MCWMHSEDPPRTTIKRDHASVRKGVLDHCAPDCHISGSGFIVLVKKVLLVGSWRIALLLALLSLQDTTMQSTK